MNSTLGTALSPFLLIFLATFVPTAFFSALNQKYFTPRQLRHSLGIACVAAVLFGVLAAALHAFIAASGFRELPAASGINTANTVCGLGALLLYGILGERFFSDLNVPRVVKNSILAGCAMVLLTLSALYSLVPFIAVLCIMLISSAVDGYRNRNVERHILITDNASLKNSESAKINNGVKLDHTPNIYLLLLESYHSPEAARYLYGLDDSETIETLTADGYTIHPNTYSNVPRTIASLTTLLSGSLSARPSDPPFILDVLRENGYACKFFSTSAYVFSNHARPEDVTSLSLPKAVAKIYAFAGPLVAQSKFLRMVVGGFDIFPQNIDFEFCFASLKREVTRKNDQPTFNLMHFGACHFFNGQDPDTFKRGYSNAFKQAGEQLRSVTKFLSEHDPNAIVIAIGDHGSMQYLTYEPYNPSLQEELKKDNICNTSFGYDIFSVLLAVKSPMHAIFGDEVISHVNIFRKVFSALGKNDLHTVLEPNISLAGENIVVRDGKILDQFENMRRQSASAHSIFKKHKNGTAMPSEILQLARMEKHKNINTAIYLLKGSLRKHPLQAPILYELGEIYLQCNNETSCTYLKKAWTMFPNDQKFAATYYLSLLLHRSEKEAEDFFTANNLHSNHDAINIKLNSIKAKTGENKNIEFILKESLAHPDDHQIRFFLAMEYYEAKLYHKAEKELRIILTTHHHEDIEYFLTNIYERALSLQFFCRAAQGNSTGIKELSLEGKGRPLSLWRLITHSVAFEQQGKINDAISCILDKVDPPALSEPALRIGCLALRHRLSVPGLEGFKKAAEITLGERMRQVEGCALFDAAWYAERNMRKGDAENPLAHYLSHGGYHGLNPTPWFGTVRYLVNQSNVWLFGAHPLFHFISRGVQTDKRDLLLVDPLFALHSYGGEHDMNSRWVDVLSAHCKKKAAISRQAA